MKVEIIAIGDELLIGQTVNTNASWLGQEFSLRGYQITRALSIADDPSQITATLDAVLPDTNCDSTV